MKHFSQRRTKFSQKLLKESDAGAYKVAYSKALKSLWLMEHTKRMMLALPLRNITKGAATKKPPIGYILSGDKEWFLPDSQQFEALAHAIEFLKLGHSAEKTALWLSEQIKQPVSRVTLWEIVGTRPPLTDYIKRYTLEERERITTFAAFAYLIEAPGQQGIRKVEAQEKGIEYVAQKALDGVRRYLFKNGAFVSPPGTGRFLLGGNRPKGKRLKVRSARGKAWYKPKLSKRRREVLAKYRQERAESIARREARRSSLETPESISD